MFYAFFWVIPQRHFICQRFRTHCLFHTHRRIHLSAYEDGTDSVLWNIGM